MSCPASHPVREAGGVDLVPDLEVMGGHSSEVWARCRACGAWFWTSTDIGSKFEYVAEVRLPTALAEDALLDGNLDALVFLLVTYRVPYGPMWTTASAFFEIFVALTPHATAAERARALSGRSRGPLWDGAAELFASQARGDAAAPPPELRFAVDLTLASDRRLEAYEVGASLVLFGDDVPDLLRLDAARLVKVPLVGPPRLLARRRDALVLAIATPAGDATLVIDAAGNATAFPPTTTTYDVAALDDGWWQFVPHGASAVRFVELHRADGSPVVKVPRQFSPGATWMPPARRLAGGWIVSNLIDDDGTVQALTLFDDAFATAASSTGITGERTVTPIDGDSFWATIDGELERWVVRGKSLERVASHVMRSCWHSGDQLLIDHPDGNVIARGRDGSVLWTWQRETTGAAYGVVTAAGVLLYDDDHAHLLDDTGAVVRTFAVEAPHVSVGAGGTVYVKTTDRLWIVRDDVRAVEVPRGAGLETTCGDRALLSLQDGYFLLVGPDRARAGFRAPDAAFSVFGTVGGPYVVEPTRIRVASFG